MKTTKANGKKILSLILTVAMVIGLLPQMAMALDYTKYYVSTQAELDDAIIKAAKEDRIILYGDITVNSAVIISKAGQRTAQQHV